jgi:hypothetical protein
MDLCVRTLALIENGTTMDSSDVDPDRARAVIACMTCSAFVSASSSGRSHHTSSESVEDSS